MAQPLAPALEMSDEQRLALQELAARSKPHRIVVQARALLRASQGMANTRIARELGVSRSTVIAWRERFAAEGLEGVGKVRPGRGRKPSIPKEKVEAIVHDTLHTKPEGATHWSTRSMARRHGVSRHTVHQIWSARGIKPHLVETFTLSNDPRFEEKLIDVVGLYLNLPTRRWCSLWTKRQPPTPR